MNKYSGVFDFMDKAAEWHNYFIDLNNENIKNEIKWLNDNYENIIILKSYFMRFIDRRNFAYYIDMVNKINSLSPKEIQDAAEIRANTLYAHIKNNEQSKINNKPLKIIAEELKRENR